MKKLLSMMALVTILGVFSTSQLQAQGVPPHQQPLILEGITLGTYSIIPGPDGAASAIQIAFATGAAVITLRVGMSQNEVLAQLNGNPIYLALLLAANIIAFDANGGLVPGSAISGGDSPEPPPTNGG